MTTASADQLRARRDPPAGDDSRLLSPQLILNAHMSRSWYLPDDPDEVARLLPSGRLTPLANRQVFLNQYVVAEEDTSGFGAFELTYVGLNVAGYDVGGFPAHWVTQYLNSNARMSAYAGERGLPAEPGRTRLEVERGRVVATTELEGQAVIRTVTRFGGSTVLARGQIGYVTQVDEELVLGRYPYVAWVA